jgi:hypothetical protein
MLTVIDLTGMAQPSIIVFTIAITIRETLERLLFAALRAYAGGGHCSNAFRPGFLLLRRDVLILYRWH